MHVCNGNKYHHINTQDIGMFHVKHTMGGLSVEITYEIISGYGVDMFRNGEYYG